LLDAAAWPAHPPRRLEHVSDARLSSSALHAAAKEICRAAGSGHSWRIHFYSDCGADRSSQVMELNSRIPSGPIEHKWDKARFDMKLVNPANKRRHSIIVVGSGLAGGAAAATLGELGYHVKCFCFQ